MKDITKEMLEAEKRRTRIEDDIHAERLRQNQKFGNQFGCSDWRWQAVLSEEVGEVAEATLDLNDPGDDRERQDTTERQLLREELVQVAAVAVAWIETLDRRNT